MNPDDCIGYFPQKVASHKQIKSQSNVIGEADTIRCRTMVGCMRMCVRLGMVLMALGSIRCTSALQLILRASIMVVLELMEPKVDGTVVDSHTILP